MSNTNCRFSVCVCGWTTVMCVCVCVCVSVRAKYDNAMVINIYTILRIGLQHFRHNSHESPK